jgi:hypothetical protein
MATRGRPERQNADAVIRTVGEVDVSQGIQRNKHLSAMAAALLAGTVVPSIPSTRFHDGGDHTIMLPCRIRWFPTVRNVRFGGIDDYRSGFNPLLADIHRR